MKKAFIILITIFLLAGGIYASKNFEATNYFLGTSTVSDFFKPKPKSTTTSLFFVGDIMLSRSVGNRMQRENDFAWPFIHIAQYLQNSDILFGNLENPISGRGTNVGSIYSFRANPKTIAGLKLAGFDALSIANNHIGDWSRIATEDTFNLLKESDILAIGGGSNKTEAHTAKTISRGDMTFGFLGYTLLGPNYIRATDTKAGITTPTLENMVRDIKAAKENSDTIIVSLHFGEEYETEANTYQKDLARKLIDAGAKLVIGHHPHVVQPGEYYKDGYIAYSLGNFMFDQHFSEETQTSIILEITMDDSEIIDLKETPIRITKDYQVILE
jgi:gamma-polyglutamate biosynthesis protein CapA